MKVIIIFSVIFLSSCSNFNSIYRSRGFETGEAPKKGKIISIDAKQRLAITKGDIYCAEPSPDAFSVYSAAIDAKVSKPEAYETALKLATGENGSTIGIRTEVIQLMRDAMYRLCEAHYSGALTPTEYKIQMAKYQKSMVTLLAINQLTNAVKPPSIVLSSTSSYGSGSDLLEAKKNLDSSNKELRKIEIEVTNKKNQYESIRFENTNQSYEIACTGEGKPSGKDSANCMKYEKLKKEYDSLVIKKNVAAQDYSEWDKVLKGEESKINLSTSNNQVITPVSSSQNKMTKDELEVIADTVRELVGSVYSEESMMDQCFQITIHKDKLNQKIYELKEIQERKNQYKEFYNKSKDLIINFKGKPGPKTTVFKGVEFNDITKFIFDDRRIMKVGVLDNDHKSDKFEAFKNDYKSFKSDVEKLYSYGTTLENIDKKIDEFEKQAEGDYLNNTRRLCEKLLDKI